MKTKEKGMEVHELAAPKEILRGQIEIDQISTTENHRKQFDADRLKELTENIKAVGVLQDIIVRPSETEGYVLICGERRLRAAKAAGLKTIPARVIEADAALANEIQAFENLHRENLNPIDEAASFKVLLDQGKYDAKALAHRVDKSESYVYRSLRLLELPEKVILAIQEEKITAAHGTVISRLQNATEQISLMQAIVAQKLSAKAAENALAGHARDISKATFDTAACAGCKHNGKKQKDLFDGDTDLDGHCMNSSCFDQKAAEAKGVPAKRKTKSKTSSAGAQGGLLSSIEAIVEHVRKDANLGYMRPLADGILRNADDRVKFEFMRRRDPSVKKSDAGRDIAKYLAKLTDFFIPGFCVEMTILSESPVKEGELVHQFKKLYGIGKSAAGSAGPADKSVQDALNQIGAQVVKDEKASKKGGK